MKELTPTIVNKLIRRIEVHNPEKKHARKAVKVDIYFTAVGLVSLPDEQEIRQITDSIRTSPHNLANDFPHKRIGTYPHSGWYSIFSKALKIIGDA